MFGDHSTMEKYNPSFELITLRIEDANSSDLPDSVLKLCKCDFLNILNNNQELLALDEDNLKKYIDKHPEKQIDILCVGIASYLLFVQANFTGPEPAKPPVVEENLQEEVNVNTKFIRLLSLSGTVFEEVSAFHKIAYWWHVRYIVAFESLLDENSVSLYAKLETAVSELKIYEVKNDRLKAELMVEIAQAFLKYGRVLESEMYLNEGKRLLKFDFELGGELGKRTKYQQDEVAQLLLKVNLDESVDRPVSSDNVVPDVIKLNDDVRLDKVAYGNSGTDTVVPALEQALLLANVYFMKRAKPFDELLSEEIQTFVSFILSQNNVWSVRVNALLLRIQNECNHKRTIEWSLSQCESIISNINSDLGHPRERLLHLWVAPLVPLWKVESLLADIMLKLGLVKGSLDIYLRLQLWEEVIVCYTVLKLRHKAAEIIKQELDKKPTVKLWCLLGDATDDESCYEKAWELSEHRSSRAQRHWGRYYYSQKRYDECIPHFNKSLEINSLQNTLWLQLGHAALTIENWELAAAAYRRYTFLEPAGFEAWNNLAKAYIKLGNKFRAHKALLESLKYNFDNWKVWRNLLIVSADTGNFDDVIRSYNKILDVQEKCLDIEVLSILVRAVSNSIPDSGGNLSNRLYPKVKDLFGRVTFHNQANAQLWELYADLLTDINLKVQTLQKAYRASVQGDWFKEHDKCKAVLELCIKLGNLSVGADLSDVRMTRMVLRSAGSAAKRQEWEDLKNFVMEVDNLLAVLTEKIENNN